MTKTFIQFPSRTGSDKDVEKLKLTFSRLGFEVDDANNDLASYDLRCKIDELARKDFKEYGCLIICLLSHGIENAIACYDGKYVNINKLKYEFSLSKCPSLYGKPKIFIVQACQGELKQDRTGIISKGPHRSFSDPTHDKNFKVLKSFSLLFKVKRYLFRTKK